MIHLSSKFQVLERRCLPSLMPKSFRVSLVNFPLSHWGSPLLIQTRQRYIYINRVFRAPIQARGADGYFILTSSRALSCLGPNDSWTGSVSLCIHIKLLLTRKVLLLVLCFYKFLTSCSSSNLTWASFVKNKIEKRPEEFILMALIALIGHIEGVSTILTKLQPQSSIFGVTSSDTPTLDVIKYALLA